MNLPAQYKAISNLPSLQSTVKKYQLNAQKSLGQNFLFDLNVVDKIASFSNAGEDTAIIEIGPGPGGLTRALLSTNSKHVIVIEKDKRCIPALMELKEIAGERLVILEDDALNIDEKSLIATHAPSTKKVKIIANLPYNIATELLIKWLHNIENIDAMTLMFQKEVAERITAQPNSKKYGRLSIISQLLCQTDIVLTLPPEAFSPPPKVDSSVVHFRVREKPLFDVSIKTLENVVKTAFSQRRKTLRSSLKQITKSYPNIFFETKIDSSLRAEQLSIEDFSKIANYL